MILSKIISTHLNQTKKYLTCQYSGNDLYVFFRLPVPAWCYDSKFLVKDNRYVRYNGSRKYNTNSYTITKNSINLPHPPVGKNKVYIEQVKYSVNDFLDKDVDEFMYKEYQNTFRELNAEILLEKIGMLSKQYDEVTSGKPNIATVKLPYIAPEFRPSVNIPF